MSKELCRICFVSFLDFDSAYKLVTDPIPGFDLKYTPDNAIAERLVRRLGCQPYLLQATMSELVNYLNQGNRKQATPADIDVAIEKMLISSGIYFEHIWGSESSELERNVMLNLASGKPLPEGSQKALRSLIRKEVLRQEDEQIQFCVPVFKEWILLND